MKTTRQILALLCVALVLAPLSALAQSYSYMQNKERNWFIRNYAPVTTPPVSFNNSGRLENLLRAGNLYLSLKDAIALALENNLDIELQRYGPQQAAANLLRAEAGGLLRGVSTSVQQGPTSAVSQATGGIGGGTGGGNATGGDLGTTAGGTVITQTGATIINLDPVVSVGFNAGHRTSPQSNTIGTGGVTGLTSDSRTTSVNIQQGFLSGTTVSAGYFQLFSESNSRGQSVNPINQGNLSLQVTQRVLQGFGFAVNNRNIRIARNNLKVADLTFQQQVIATTSNIIGLYWDLVSINADFAVKKQSVDLAAKLFEDNKKQVEIGTLAPIEVIRAEAELARTQQELTVSETQLLQQEAIIKNVLSRNGITSENIKNARIIPTDTIRLPDVRENLDLTQLYDIAVSNRPEIEQTSIGLQNTRIGIAGNKSQLLPSLDVTASFQNNGLAGSFNPIAGPNVPPVDPYFLGGRGEVLAQLFRRNFPDYSIGFQLNVPLRNRAARADIIIEEISMRQQEIRQQQQLNQLKVSVQNSITALQQAEAGVRTAQKSRELQEQTLDAEQKKFALGATTIFFVIQAQRDLAQARSAEVGALGTYVKAKNNLDQTLGLTLERNDISIDEARSGTVARDSQIPLEYLQTNRNN